MKIKSPAKLNLYLKVTGRRPDGYHKLVTLFHRISLSDTLVLSRRPSGIKLTCKISGLKQKLSCGEDNLIVKAYRLLRKEFPGLGGVRVQLTKKIPMGAGLGGGSGNAAAFLLGMKELYRLKISDEKFLKLGSLLGADVAFFMMGEKQAVGRGVGDILCKIPGRVKLWFVLVVSDKGLSTPEVYRSLPRALPAVSLTRINHTVRLLCASLERRQADKVAGLLENDLEAPAFKLRPELGKQLKGMHEKGIPASRMTGSGPTLFSVFFDSKAARKTAQELRREFPKNKIFVCSTY